MLKYLSLPSLIRKRPLLCAAGLGAAILTGSYIYRNYTADEDHSSGKPCDGSGPAPPAVTSSISHHTRLTINHFTFVKELGQGGFGKVFLAELKGRGEYFAVKALQKRMVLQNNGLEYTRVERRVLALAGDNPFIAHLYSTFQDKDHLYFVMEYLNGGSLYSHIQDKGIFDLYRSTFYSAEIIVGLQFLHARGIIHRDLKPENVMVDRDGHIKIIDFGLSKENVFGENRATSQCGTLQYMAPEVYLKMKYTSSVDWWSFGVLLYEMLTTRLPFEGNDDCVLIQSIMRVDTPHYPLWITRDAKDLLGKLFELNPSRRLGVVGSIREHPFFKTLNWPAVELRELDPPFKPKVEEQHCSNVDQERDSIDQRHFAGFSYTDPEMECPSLDSCPEIIVPDNVQQSKSETGVSPWLWVGAAAFATGALIGWIKS